MKSQTSNAISVVRDSITSVLGGIGSCNPKAAIAMDSVVTQFRNWVDGLKVVGHSRTIAMDSDGLDKTLAEHAATCEAKTPETCPYVKKMAKQNMQNGMDKAKAMKMAIAQHTQAVAQAQKTKQQGGQPQQQAQQTPPEQPQQPSQPQYDPEMGKRIAMTLPQPLTIETDFGQIIVDTDVKKEVVEKLVEAYENGAEGADYVLNKLISLTETAPEGGTGETAETSTEEPNAESQNVETPTAKGNGESTGAEGNPQEEEGWNEIEQKLYRYRDFVEGLQKQSLDAYDAGDMEKSERLYRQALEAAQTYNDIYHQWKEYRESKGESVEAGESQAEEPQSASQQAEQETTEPSEASTGSSTQQESAETGNAEQSTESSEGGANASTQQEGTPSERQEGQPRSQGIRRWDEDPDDARFATGRANEFKVGDTTYVDVSKMSPLRAMFHTVMAGLTGKGVITKFDRIFGGWEKTKNEVSQPRNTLRDAIVGSTVLEEMDDRLASMEDGIAKEALGDIREMLANATTPEKKLAAKKKYLAWQKDFGAKGIGALEDDDENHKMGGVTASGMPHIKDINVDGLGGTDKDGVLTTKADVLEKVKQDFHANGFDFDEESVKETITPSLTRLEFPLGDARPSDAKVKSLIEDIKFKLPISGTQKRDITYDKDNGTICVSIENDSKGSLGFSTLAKSDAWKSRRNDGKGAFFLGVKQEDGSPIIASLDEVVHMLIAGTTGSGKSTRIDSIVCSLMDGSAPEDLQFIMIDPKKVTFPKYKNNPYVKDVITDMDKAASRFNWAVNEMENRYAILEKAGVSDINAYNKLGEEGRLPAGLPSHLGRQVIVVDELSNLMESHGAEVESSIKKLGEKARAAGIHLILATQRPDVKAIPGSIKANIPTKVGLTTSNETDSRIIGISGLSKIPKKGPFVISGGGFEDVAGDGVFIDGDREVPELMNRIKNTYEGNSSDTNVPSPSNANSSSTTATETTQTTENAESSAESSSQQEPQQTTSTEGQRTSTVASQTETQGNGSTGEQSSTATAEQTAPSTEQTEQQTSTEGAESQSATATPKYDMRTREGRMARLNSRYDARLKELEDKLNSGELDDDAFDAEEEALDKWRKSQETAIEKKFPRAEGENTETTSAESTNASSAQETRTNEAQGTQPSQEQHRSPFESIDTPEAKMARADKKAELAIKAAERTFNKTGDRKAYEDAIASAKAEYEQEVDDIKNNRTAEEIRQRDEEKQRQKAESEKRLRDSIVTERKGKPIPGATPNSYRGDPANLTPLSSKEIGTIESAMQTAGLDGWQIDQSPDHGDKPVKDASGKTYVRNPTNGSYGYVRNGQFHYVVNTLHPDYLGEKSTRTQEIKSQWKEHEDDILRKKDEIGRLSKAGPLYASKVSEMKRQLQGMEQRAKDLYTQYRNAAFGTDEMPDMQELESESSLKDMVLDALQNAIAFG